MSTVIKQNVAHHGGPSCRHGDTKAYTISPIPASAHACSAANDKTPTRREVLIAALYQGSLGVALLTFFSAWPPNTYRPPKLAQVVYCPTLLWTAIHFSASLPWVTVGIAFRRNEFSAKLTRSCWTRDSPSWKPYITGLFALSSSSPSECSLVCHLFRT